MGIGWSRLGRSAATDDELGREYLVGWCFASHGCEQRAGRGASDLAHGLVDRAERRVCLRGDLVVVEAHHQQVTGDVPAPSVGGLQRPDGHAVGGAEERVDARTTVQETSEGDVSGAGAVVTRFEQVWVEVRAL